MFRQDRTNPSTAVSNWHARLNTKNGWPSTAVSTWLNGGLFAAAGGVAGYYGGGSTGSGNTDVIRKMDFNNDVAATIAATLNAAAYLVSGMANSGTAGYFGGGLASSNLTTVDKIDFSDDSRTTLGTGLSAAKQLPAGLGNTGVAGYFAGGLGTSSVDKFSFSDDSRTTLGTGLDGSTNTGTGFSNSGTAGYATAGYVDLGSGFGCQTTVYKITYSDDSMSTLSTGLATGSRYNGAMANVGTAGYVGGGYPCGDPYLDTVNKFSFSDDSRTTLSTGLSQGLYAPSGYALTGTAGYFVAGTCCAGVSWTKQTQAEKFSFADDSRSIVSSVLATGTNSAGAMANEGAFE